MLTRSETLRAPTLMRPYALFYLYRNRLRVHVAQELLAGLGVAIAVALVFAVTVANGSILGSASQVVHAVVGPVSLQLRARNTDGFDESLLARVEHISGVKQTAALLEQTATLVGPHASHVTVDLAGANLALATLDGLAHTLPFTVLSTEGIGLTRASANALGITTSTASHRGVSSVALLLRGRTYQAGITAVLGPETIGALSEGRMAVMPLGRLQQLAGLPRRISRILIEVQPGHEAAVRDELRRLVGERLMVTPTNQDVTLLRQALGPSNQASTLFAVISVLLGFLFAFNAMLLTVPERRQAIADLRVDGTRRTAIVQMVIFQAVCLGLAASLVGLFAGYMLSRSIFRQSPGYLSQAFPLGTNTVIGVRPLLLALAGGVLATCLASLIPLLDLRRRRALDAVYSEAGEPGNRLGRHTQRRLSTAALGLLLLASALFVLLPSAAIITCIMLALATILAVPAVLAGGLHVAGAIARRYQRLTILPVALTALKATTLRSLALAAMGAVALFGSVALGGARDGLLRGIRGVAHNFAGDASIWIISPHDNQATVPFLPDHHAEHIATIPGVASVRAFGGSFFDWNNRRSWIIARPAGSSPAILAGQITDGQTDLAAARLNKGGWIVVSKQIAEEHHTGVGNTLVLPAPAGSVRFKIAATSTNFGWPTGVMFMNTADYRHDWQTPEPTAFGITLAPNANLEQVRNAIKRVLGSGSGLEVLTAHTREVRIDASAGEGLGQLSEISLLLVFAAILAMVAALGSNIWQRRASFAGLRIEGARPARLRRVLLIEALLMLGAGCLTGALAGVYGQFVIDSYLRHVTGFPVVSIAVGTHLLEIFVLVVVAVLMVATIPGWLASRVSPTLVLNE